MGRLGGRCIEKGDRMKISWPFVRVVVVVAVICLFLSSQGEAVYVSWWKTPAGDSMVNDTTDALQVHLVGDETGTASVTEDGDLPASATVGQVASIDYRQAVAHGSGPTAVSAGNRVGLLANREGVPFVVGGHPNLQRKTFTIAAADGTRTDQSLVGTIGTGTKVVVTEFSAKVSPANSANVTLRVGCGATNTPAASLTGATLLTDATYASGAMNGEHFGDGGGMVLVCGDGEEVRYTSSAPTGGHLYITLSYYTSAS